MQIFYHVSYFFSNLSTDKMGPLLENEVSGSYLKMSIYMILKSRKIQLMIFHSLGDLLMIFVKVN